ncbi:MAG: heme exporter protein B [Bradymonadia bacterium]
MSAFSRRVRAIVAKDLRIELRSREVIYTSVLFSIVLVTLFLFSGFSERAVAREAGPGVLWTSLAFVGTLIFSRTFQREREERAVAGLLMVPGILDALFVSKLIVNLALLLVVEAVLVPAVAVSFHMALMPVLPSFLGVLALATLGYATLGTVLAATLATVRLREVILPLVLYPLCLPMLLSGVQATSGLLAGEAIGGWVRILAIFAILFLVLSRWLFGEALDPRHA